MNVALHGDVLEATVLTIENHGQAIFWFQVDLHQAIEPSIWYYNWSKSLKNHGYGRFNRCHGEVGAYTPTWPGAEWKVLERSRVNVKPALGTKIVRQIKQIFHVMCKIVATEHKISFF